MNGNYLVIIVSIAVILPLALMKQLGECELSCPSYTGILISPEVHAVMQFFV